jgi:hypothetical protein
MAWKPSADGSRRAASACRRTVAIAAAEGRRAVTPHPDRQAIALGRLRFHRDRVGVEPFATPFDALVAPTRTEQCDGLVHHPTTDGEVLTERVVLGLLPADTHAEPYPPGRQGVERADLLGDEDGLPLWQYEHLGGERRPLGHRGDEGEGCERLEHRHLGGIDRCGANVGGVAHDDVVEHGDVVVPDRFDRTSERCDARRTFAVRDAGELDGQLHRDTECHGR